MANKFVIKNGLLAEGRVDVTGSLSLSQGVNATGGFTGSLFGTASYALAANIDTGSLVTNAQTASFAKTNITNTFTAAQVFNGNVTINATASIAYLNVAYETASVIYSSGSNQFGDDTNDVQLLIGTTKVSGSLQVTGSIYGNLIGTSSWATNAVNATSATNATNASSVGITDNPSGAGTYYVTFVSSNSGNQNITVDSSTLTYDPSTNTLTVDNLAGSASYVAGANVNGAVGDSTRLNGQVASYYLNASNINTGTLSNSYLPSAINVTSVTASFKGNVDGNASTATTASFASTVPIAGITGLASNVATFLQTPSSVNLASAVTDETGTGALVFANSPTLQTPIIGAATGTSLKVTGNVSGSSISPGSYSTIYSSKVNCAKLGVTDIANIDVNSTPCTGIHIRYTLDNTTVPAGKNLRAGTLIVVSDVSFGGSAANIAESTTQDIGDTSVADFVVSTGGSVINVSLDLSTSTENYTVVFDYTLM